MKKVTLDIDNISKKYKIYNKPIERLKEAIHPFRKIYHHPFYALNNVSLKVFKGDAIGIVGKNGSGKSTLLKIITGVIHATEGMVEVNGTIASILELGTGFNPEYTGIENIYLNGTMLGLEKEEIDNKVNSIIEFADIGEFINQSVKLYSSGMFARLAFAVAVSVEPDILIVDEALAVGDLKFQIKCIDKMKSLKEQGTTILFVSHATEQVKRFCNKAVWLKDGEVHMIGESSEVVDLYEDYMKNNIVSVEDKPKETEGINLKVEKNQELFANIDEISINKENISTFEAVEIEIQYEIYEEEIKDFLVGVAIYTSNREYVFGPNTYLDKVKIPNQKGKHIVKYKIPEMTLLGGAYHIDVGIFKNEGLNCIDYKTDEKMFTITNQYFSEGKVYIKHEWEVIK